MGGKRTGTGKYLYCCTAILICFSLARCSSVERPLVVQDSSPQYEAEQRLIQAQKLLAKGDFEAALQENRKVLSSQAPIPRVMKRCILRP